MKKSFTRDSKAPQTVASVLIAGILVFLLSQSVVISTAFSLFVGIFITVAQHKSADKKSLEIQSAAPEMIDHLITGLSEWLSGSWPIGACAVL
jgi:tight adherence protein B